MLLLPATQLLCLLLTATDRSNASRIVVAKFSEIPLMSSLFILSISMTSYGFTTEKCDDILQW